MKINIYALQSKGKTWYIGKTKNKIHNRLKQHINTSGYKDEDVWSDTTPKYVFLRDLTKKNIIPTVKLLAQLDESEAKLSEYWYICKAIKAGDKLMNQAKGESAPKVQAMRRELSMGNIETFESFVKDHKEYESRETRISEETRLIRTQDLFFKLTAENNILRVKVDEKKFLIKQHKDLENKSYELIETMESLSKAKKDLELTDKALMLSRNKVLKFDEVKFAKEVIETRRKDDDRDLEVIQAAINDAITELEELTGKNKKLKQTKLWAIGYCLHNNGIDSELLKLLLIEVATKINSNDGGWISDIIKNKDCDKPSKLFGSNKDILFEVLDGDLPPLCQLTIVQLKHRLGEL